MPPPHHYEYTITIGPDLCGEIAFLPDYPSDETPVWKESFDISDGALTGLYSLIAERGVFSTDWREMDDPPVGGELEWMKVTARGTDVLVPSTLIEEQAKAISPVYDILRSAVPKSVWDKLMALREQYQRDYSA